MLELFLLFSIAAEVGKPEVDLNKKYNLDKSEIKIILTEMSPSRLSLCKASVREQAATLKINEFKFKELTEEKQAAFVISRANDCKNKVNI